MRLLNFSEDLFVSFCSQIVWAAPPTVPQNTLARGKFSVEEAPSARYFSALSSQTNEQFLISPGR